VNRFPTWKYGLIALAIALAFLYTLPNFFGESPAVQVASAKSTVRIDPSVIGRVEQALQGANIHASGMIVDPTGVRLRFADPDTQLRAKDVIDHTLNPDPKDPAYSVALNLLSASPSWLTAIHALPMYLGLDLRGGVHFLLQVDTAAAITKRIENLAGDLRAQLRDKNIRHGGVSREGDTIRIRFREAAVRDQARQYILNNIPDLVVSERDDGQNLLLVCSVKPEFQKRVMETALQQNIQTLHKRVNELGVASR